MRSTFKVLFYVKKGSAKPNGNLPLMCRLTVDGEIKVVSPLTRRSASRMSDWMEKSTFRWRSIFSSKVHPTS